MNQLKAIANKATEAEMNVLCNWFSWKKIVAIYPNPADSGFTIGEHVFNNQLMAVNFLKRAFQELRNSTLLNDRLNSVNWVTVDIILPATDLVPVKVASRAGDVMRIHSVNGTGVSLFSGHDITKAELDKGKPYILVKATRDQIATEDEYGFLLVVRRIFGFTKVRITNDGLDFIEYGF